MLLIKADKIMPLFKLIRRSATVQLIKVMQLFKLRRTTQLFKLIKVIQSYKVNMILKSITCYLSYFKRKKKISI